MRYFRLGIMTAVLLLGQAAIGSDDVPLASVSGHAIFLSNFQIVDHQPVIDAVSVNAWVTQQGQVRGRLLWTSIYNGLDGDQGPGVSGWTWMVDVDTYYVVSENEAYVEGWITKSTWADDPSVGMERVGFYIYDAGGDNRDGLYQQQIPPGPEYSNPIIRGNFSVRH